VNGGCGGGERRLAGRLQIFCCCGKLSLPLFADIGDAPLLLNTAVFSSPIRPQPLTPYPLPGIFKVPFLPSCSYKVSVSYIA